jgi:hypothetical protein
VKKDWRRGNRKNKIVVIFASISAPTLRCVVCIEYHREFERSWWFPFQYCGPHWVKSSRREDSVRVRQKVVTWRRVKLLLLNS